MIVSVASGKGGTGKTTVTASLTSVWDGPVHAVDLDVEEPNLHLFLNPDIAPRKRPACRSRWWRRRSAPTAAPAPICVSSRPSVICKTLVLTFPEMCHGCGGCMAVCPEKAISEGTRELGEISWGEAGRVGFLMGRLRVGEAMSPPLMRQVKAKLDQMLASKGGDAIIDAPPGVSCPAVNAVIDSDVIVLVTEPTPFGFYDFELAWRSLFPFKQADGGRDQPGRARTTMPFIGFCRDKGIPILAEIPYDRTIAEAYSRGRIIAETSPELQEIFVSLMGEIRELANQRRTREAAHA